MKVVILCGGMGTRLKEETEFRPKPMVEIGGKPILWHIMRLYAHHGFKSFVLCLGYKGALIKEYFLNYEYTTRDITVHLGQQKRVTVHDSAGMDNWDVTLADTGAETMTGGRIKRIEKYIDGDDFLATYGDGLADVNLPELIAFHKRMGCVATVTGFHPESRFGLLQVDERSRVKRFEEKPRLDGMISGGFFVFSRKIFDYLDDHGTLEQEPMRRLAADGQMAVYHHRGFWKSMDTYRDFQEFNQMWDRGETPWKVW